MISEKSITRYTLLHCVGARMYEVSQHTRHTKKIMYQNFQFFLPLKKITFKCTCDFFRYRHVYTYRRKEFQNILERKLRNCFGHLLLIYYKNVEDGFEHDIDSAYGDPQTLGIHEFYCRFNEYLAI